MIIDICMRIYIHTSHRNTPPSTRLPGPTGPRVTLKRRCNFDLYAATKIIMTNDEIHIFILLMLLAE